MPKSRVYIDPEWLWRQNGVPWQEIAGEIGCHYVTAVRKGREMGFLRGRGSTTWEEGPCLGCGEITKVRDMRIKAMCGSCADPVDAKPRLDRERAAFIKRRRRQFQDARRGLS